MITGVHNLAYIEYTAVYDWWFEDVEFYELYDLDQDPYQLHNIYPEAPANVRDLLLQWMEKEWTCGGTVNSNCTVTMTPEHSEILKSLYSRK